WASAGLPADAYHHAPIDDRWNYTPVEDWYKAVEAATRQCLDAGGRLYAHCHMGINRGPSAAMLALLTQNPDLDPFDAFLTIREARPAAGLVYAEAVGVRHLLNRYESDSTA